MKSLVSRTLLLGLLFLAVASSLLVSFLGVSSVDPWIALGTDMEAGLPVGGWLLLLIAALAAGIAWWTELANRSSVTETKRVLEALVLNEDKVMTVNEMRHIPAELKPSLMRVNRLLKSQRTSLSRISNERAENQEKLIQEQLVMERQRLARELHDSVSQQLFAASMLLSSMTEGQEAPPLLLQTEKMVQQAQLEMRALLLHLRPAALHNKSLRQGLFELLTELKEKVYFTIEYKLEDVPLPKGAEDHLFRIAQETLSNTLRHSKATEVHVLFVERNGLAILRVQDNGVGFGSDQAKSTSYGLKHIEERAVEIGAVSKIVSVPSEGTIVEVKVPIERRESDDSSAARG
ncbi:sensor histidine kinase [Planococcus lenghuensis]|uniref:histidine kinase n=1 Tax=Planococcus lenghuensis TaxID=2213202 RepID=A0A1Q2L1Q5_9BACL|nr:sensor histidine kinase [Planococcus lenghuensis]AQQ54390.1 two-component sensor histidine kinase [Planococcus lenghuensis]